MKSNSLLSVALLLSIVGFALAAVPTVFVNPQFSDMQSLDFHRGVRGVGRGTLEITPVKFDLQARGTHTPKGPTAGFVDSVEFGLGTAGFFDFGFVEPVSAVDFVVELEPGTSVEISVSNDFGTCPETAPLACSESQFEGLCSVSVGAAGTNLKSVKLTTTTTSVTLKSVRVRRASGSW
eukprot:CAMPEP_0196662054 /NCGR_PEP_ID=MMETSP1086-20130531/47012_1 /TAXON_ID=77921 /ORGANISM="Cyanoptyche  gloeocystis , Strain SAG4.97" /LENGTH=178 /DNA_ID=CAMNT_0041997245 /DNA_START=237 /DNA_END=770 /DNA_ORIENTATION=+